MKREEIKKLLMEMKNNTEITFLDTTETMVVVRSPKGVFWLNGSPRPVGDVASHVEYCEPRSATPPRKRVLYR